ncbi:inositol monophosphatase family protein [Nocardia suismassiliense]|uniref:inositol monophosphatase family protein n=1 Tax=Nocardia suismassiliense TaxID=2077092 RepID=UPI001F245CB4|nr:inositol monophosphatase family protein [Nocardia suismassiliense]
MRAGNVMNLVLPDTLLDVAAEVAVTAAVEAGHAIRAGLLGALTVHTKDATGDVVTDLDLRAEQIILGHLRRVFPDHRILAEESGVLDSTDDTWCWVVDPLDGTNNITIGLPVCTVGIALCHNGTPVLGVVHEPIADHTWTAVRGRGAFGPNGPLWHPAHRPAAAPVLAWLQGYPVTRADPTARALRLTLESASRRLIQLWSPLLCWVMLSNGDIDGFVGYRAGLIDLPAGALLARESGMHLTDFDGTTLDERLELPVGEVDFIAGSAEMIPELTLLVKSAAEVTVTGLPD